MAADTDVTLGSSGSCCGYKEKFLESEERRHALRTGINLLKLQLAKYEADILNLKKTHEEERARAEIEAKAKESAIRGSLENEISMLKSELALSQETTASSCQDADVETNLLRTRVSEGETKIIQLKKDLDKERKRGDSEKKKAGAEKKKVTKAGKLVKSEKSNAEEEKRVAVVERSRAEEFRLRAEASEAAISELKDRFEKERKNKDLEKKRADTEKKKATEALNLVESEKKKYEEERRVADVEICLAKEGRLCLEASKDEVKKVRAELVAERSKTEEVLRKLELEKQNVNREKKQAESEVAKAEELRKCLDEEKKKLIHEKNQVLRKLELEKQKAGREKKRADSEMEKYEEQRKCVDEEKKKLMDEMNRSHHLSQQLREERERNKALEKEIHETMSGKNLERTRSVLLDTVGGAVNVDSIILFKKELELEKLQLKHAKKVAKFEKRRNDLLKREVSYLKQQFTRLARRLNILDDCFTDSLEGINASAEFRNSLELQCSNTNGKVPGNKFTSNGEGELSKTHFTSTRHCDDYGPTLKYSTLRSGGGCIKSISGISSELESLIGVSVRNNSSISPVYSTSTSLSDGPLVGSQGNHALTVASPADLQGKSLSEGSAIPRFSGEMPTPRINENLQMPTENVRNVIQGHEESVLINLNGHNNISAVGREPGGGTKRSTSENETHSSGFFSSKGKKLHSQAEELSTVHDASIQNVIPPVVCYQVDRTSEAQGDGRCGNTLLLDGLHGTEYRPSKRRKVYQKQNLIEEACFEWGFEKQSDNLLIEVDRLLIEVDRDGGGHTRAVPINSSVDTVQTCRVETTVNFEDEEMTRFFEKMMTEDCIKLLELDNEDDEQLYRMAMEAPLSPTLPGIEMPNMEATERDYSTIMVEEGGHRVGANENGNFVQSCSVDVVDDTVIFQGSGSSDGSALHQINEPNNPFDVQKNVEDIFHSVVDTAETLDHQVFEQSIDTAAVRQMVTFGQGTEVPCKSIDIAKEEKICRYFVAFPNTKEKNSFARIVAACETCIFKSSMGCQKDWVAQTVLPAFATENNLLPEEKAAVLLSFLLHNSPAVSEMSSSGSTFCSDSFRRHINTAMSDVEVKHVLLESCQLDTLLSLIEGFLIDRRVLVYHDVSYGQPCDSGSIIIVDGKSITVSFRPATIEQVVCGSIIFASVCATTGHTGFICAATYNILRTYLSDSSVMLTVLHVFAAVYGPNYFKQSTYSLIMAVVKSLVTVLERGNAVVGVVRASNNPSASESQFAFPNCSECVFSEGAISVDEVVLLLLEKLQNHTVPMTERELMMLLESSDCSALDVEIAEQNSEHEIGHGGLDVDFDASCFMYKHGARATSHSLSVHCGIFNHFRDILSLLELVACYMRWSWTWTKIVPYLLKMLELCVTEKFSAAIVILLGQLGRFGIDDSGQEETGVEELRCSLSSLLDQKAMRKWGLPTQFAIVHALIGLISVDFRKLVKNDKDLPADSSLSVHIDLIQLWFSQLTEEQKSWSFEIFQSPPVD